MIRFSVSIQRGCFGGCTFCSITEHEGRIIQSRSEDSVLREIEKIRDQVPGFTGVISDLGGPTANMYRLACKSREIESACRRPSCVYPGICPNLNTDHAPLIELYRKARALPGIKKVLIASGVRYDLAVESPEYVRELAQHHVGGYLKIAPEHLREGPLSKMMKPGVGTYYRFKELFDRYSKEAGKEQYLIPYFIAAHPGTTDEDMLELALWLKRNGFRADQVQAFLPSPMATATAMYHSGKNPLKRITRDSEEVVIPKGLRVRRLHKAFLRYHDANNWPLLREALRRMGRADLIGSGAPSADSRLSAARHRCRRGAASARARRAAVSHAAHRDCRVCHAAVRGANRRAIVTRLKRDAAQARRFCQLAAVLLALATVLGALGAHALQTAPGCRSLRGAADRAAVISSSIRLGLLGAGTAAGSAAVESLLHVAGWLLLAGIVLFSGSLYLLLAGAPRMLGVLTPIGGPGADRRLVPGGAGAARSRAA